MGQVKPSVSVIIVNFRTPELTLAAVESALKEPETLEVIVVENGSGDRSPIVLNNELSGRSAVTVLMSETNLGFGRGNNLGAAAATGEYLFLLNSDAAFCPNALRACVSKRLSVGGHAIISPDVRIARTGVRQPDAFGVFPTAWRIIRQTTKVEYESLSPDWVSGCALMIDRSLFESIGGFDDELFMYYEDVLLCWRARQFGAGVYRTLEGQVMHLGGESYDKPRRQKAQYFRSQALYLRKTKQPLVLRGLLGLARHSLRLSNVR